MGLILWFWGVSCFVVETWELWSLLASESIRAAVGLCGWTRDLSQKHGWLFSSPLCTWFLGHILFFMPQSTPSPSSASLLSLGLLWFQAVRAVHIWLLTQLLKYFVNGWIITSLLGFLIDWPNTWYIGSWFILWEVLLWPLKSVIWLKIVNHRDYLQRKITEFPLLAIFKIRKFICVELLRAAK